MPSLQSFMETPAAELPRAIEAALKAAGLLAAGEGGAILLHGCPPFDGGGVDLPDQIKRFARPDEKVILAAYPMADLESPPADPAAVSRLDAIIAFSPLTADLVARHGASADRTLEFPPFFDLSSCHAARAIREATRASMRARTPLDNEACWLALEIEAGQPGAGALVSTLMTLVSRLIGMKWALVVITDGDLPAGCAALMNFVPGGSVAVFKEPDGAARDSLVAACDLYCAPEPRADAGISLIRAQACGVGVLTPKSALSSAVVKEGYSGRLCLPGNPASFEHGVRFLLEHPEFRLSAAREAPGYVVDNHDLRIAGPLFAGMVAKLLQAEEG